MGMETRVLKEQEMEEQEVVVYRAVAVCTKHCRRHIENCHHLRTFGVKLGTLLDSYSMFWS